MEQIKPQRVLAAQKEKPDNGIAGVPQEIVVGTGGGLAGLAADPHKMVTGAVYLPASAEKRFEAVHFKIAALVAHIHHLVQMHLAVPVQLDGQIPQLRPGQKHHGKIRVHSAETAAQLSGSDAVRGLETLDLPGQGAAQEKYPVQNRQEQQPILHKVVIA